MVPAMTVGTTSGSNSGGYKTIVYVICSVAALGGLLFGLDQGFIANSLATIQRTITRCPGRGALLVHPGDRRHRRRAALGLFARLLGRKKSLLLAGFIFTAASALSALLPPLPVLSACRFALGFGVGVASFVVPLFLSETAPASIRGSMGTLFQLMITIGIFLISLTNVFIARAFTKPSTSLPLMFLTITLFAAMMFFGGFILPESPRWLMLKRRKEQAIAVLQRTMNTQQEIDAEIAEIEQALHGPQGAGVGIVMRGYFIKVLVVGVLLQMFQQLVGINMMIYYSPTIFGYAGIKGLLAAMTVPTVNMLFTFPAIRLVEKWGRKKLLYVGAITMLVTMIAAGVAFQAIGSVRPRNDRRHAEGSAACIGDPLHLRLCGLLGTGRLARVFRNFPARGPRNRDDDHDHGQLDVRRSGDGERALIYASAWERVDLLCVRRLLRAGDRVRRYVRARDEGNHSRRDGVQPQERRPTSQARRTAHQAHHVGAERGWRSP